MQALKMFQISKKYHCFSGNVFLRFSTISSQRSSLLGHHLMHRPLTVRKFSFGPFDISFPFNITMQFFKRFGKSRKSEQRVGNKDVYLVEDHFNHPEVQRNALVNKLSQTIQDTKSKCTKVVYVYGLPGIGKKELVRQFAKQHYEMLEKKNIPKKFVAMINASDPNSFHHDLFKVAEQADAIENFEEYTKKTSKVEGYKDILTKISSRLKDRSNWLLVLKDINLGEELNWQIGYTPLESVEFIKLQAMNLSDYLPSPGYPSHGTIIVTTSNNNAYSHKKSYTKCFTMPKGMEDKEALELLQHASGFDLQTCKQPALRVVHGLENVPTSVFCAGLLVLAKRNRKLDNKNDPHSLFEDLYKTIQDPNFCGIMKTASEERIKNAKYPVNMRKIQKLTVDSLTISDPSRKEVYTLLACCAPSAIPVQWITNVVMWSEKDAFIEKQMYGSSHSRVKINSDIRNDLSWFQALFGGSNTPSSKLINYEVVQIAKGYHDIFKELFINGNENLSESLKHFVYHMIQYYDENSRKDDVYTITTRKHLLPHVNSFLQLIKTNEDMRNLFEAEIADLYLCLGNAYTLEAELLKPMEYFEKALEFYRSQGKRYILRQIQACIQLGKAYRDDSDKLMKSMSYLDEAKGLLDQYDDKDYHILWNTFKMWYYKGDTNKSLGKYRDSQSCFLKCLEVLQEMQEIDPTDEVKHLTFMTYSKLCGVIRIIGHDEECRMYIEKAEEMIPDLYENQDYSIMQAGLKHQKAIILRDQCLPYDSVKLLREACTTFKKVYGKEHVKVALIESELSVSLRHQNKLSESEKVALSALEKLQQGDLYHSEKSKALCNLGSTYTHLCKFKDAQTALQQAFELAKKHFDMSSGTCIIKKTEILEKMGTLERRQGNVNESLKLLIQCVDLQKKHYSHYSSQHPDHAQALLSLGKTQHRMCLLADSLDSLNAAFEINKKHFGSDYSQTMFIEAYIAKVLRDCGDTDESLTRIHDIIARYEKHMEKKELAVHLKKHPQYAAMYATKGMLQMDNFIQNPDQQDLGKQALNTLRKAMEFHKTYLDAPSVLLEIEILCHLARVHCEMKNFKKATIRFQMADDLVKESIGRNHPLAATVLASWSRVYYDNENVEKAIKMLENAWEIRNGFLHDESHPNPLLYAYFLTKYHKEIGNYEKALHWCHETIEGYARLISKEEVRVEKLKQEHWFLKDGQLPACALWRQRLDDCRDNYKELMDL